MIKPRIPVLTLGKALLLSAACFCASHSASAQPVFAFPLNEGPPSITFTDSVQSLVGTFGLTATNDANGAGLDTDSPSGQPGDGCMTNASARAYLIAEDTNATLNLVSGPITMESWIKINPSFAGAVEGVVSYGSAYKLGFKSGRLVFTLFGKADITNTVTTPLPAGEWVHIATMWQPGSGVSFCIGSNSLFAATSNFVVNANTTTRSPLNNYLSIGSEGFANGLVGSFDRVRIHNAVLDRSQLDEDPLVPATTYGSTRASYDFNQTTLPATNTLTPALPAYSGDPLVPITTGPVWTTNGPASSPYALLFDGSRIRAANIPDPTQLITLGPDTSGTNGDYTMQAWVKLPIGFEPTNRMIMFQYQGKPAFSFSINVGRTLHTTTLGLNDVPSGALVPNDNQWHHVAAVHQNGVQFLFYVDGVLLSRMPYVRGVGSQTTYIAMIGGSTTGGNPFTGSLGRVRLNKGALTPAEFDIPGFVPPPPAPAGDITSDLLLHYKLDETNGLVAVDNTANHLPATLVKFPGDNSQWQLGRVAGALRFQTNGIATNSTLAIISNSPGTFNFATNLTGGRSCFSVAAWVNANSAQIVGAGVAARGFGPEQFALDIQGGGNLRFIIRNATGIPTDAVTLGSNNNLRTTNRWVHVVGVCDGANTNNGMRIYIDGILANANTNPPVVWNINHDVTFGSREFNGTTGYSQAYNGLIDDLRIYKRALTPNDVKTLYDHVMLDIASNGTLSWPSWASNYVAQSVTNLTSGNWVDVPGSSSLTPNGYFNTQTVPFDTEAKYYRLRSP